MFGLGLLGLVDVGSTLRSLGIRIQTSFEACNREYDTFRNSPESNEIEDGVDPRSHDAVVAVQIVAMVLVVMPWRLENSNILQFCRDPWTFAFRLVGPLVNFVGVPA